MDAGGTPQLVGLSFRPGGRAAWFGPLAAALAGALASHRLSADAGTLVTLGLVAVLVDPVMGGLWAAVTGSGWRQRWQASAEQAKAARLLPHTVVGSAAHVAGGWLARVTAPGLADPVTACAVFFAAGIALAAALGPMAVALTVVGTVMAVTVSVVGAGTAAAGALEALYFFGLTWALGFAAAGGADLAWWPAVAFAAVWVVVYWGYRRLCAGGGSGALVALDGGQAAAVILLAAWGRPWLAGVVALLLAAQALGQPGIASLGANGAQSGAPAYARNSLVFLLPALLISFL